MKFWAFNFFPIFPQKIFSKRFHNFHLKVTFSRFSTTKPNETAKWLKDLRRHSILKNLRPPFSQVATAKAKQSNVNKIQKVHDDEKWKGFQIGVDERENFYTYVNDVDRIFFIFVMMMMRWSMRRWRCIFHFFVIFFHRFFLLFFLSNNKFSFSNLSAWKQPFFFSVISFSLWVIWMRKNVKRKKKLFIPF